MGLFSKKKKEEDKKKIDKESVKIDNGVKDKKSMKDLYSGEKIEKGQENRESKEKKEEKKTGESKNKNAYRILVKPLITEKASVQGADHKYFFAVDKNANKIEIAKAINEVYGVKPVGVNIINMIGKKARHGRIFGKRKDWKKAIVKLPKGTSIKIYEGV